MSTTTTDNDPRTAPPTGAAPAGRGFIARRRRPFSTGPSASTASTNALDARTRECETMVLKTKEPSVLAPASSAEPAKLANR